MFVVPDFWVKGVHIQCSIPVVGLSDQPGQQGSVPVLVAVTGPWEVVEGRCRPVHLEPRGSQESGSPLLQPLTLCKLFHRGLGSPLSVVSLR